MRWSPLINILHVFKFENKFLENILKILKETEHFFDKSVILYNSPLTTCFYVFMLHALDAIAHHMFITTCELVFFSLKLPRRDLNIPIQVHTWKVVG